DNLKKDLSEGKVAKYQTETIPVATLEDLKRKAVLGANETLTRSISGTPTFDVIMNADICRVSTPEAFTSTIYEMDLPSGIITCMYGAKGDLYNPMGLFKINVPEIKAYYAVNSEAAKAANAGAISQAESQFAPLMENKQQMSQEVQQANNSGYLTIPELLLAAVLTDDEIIDIPATKATGKFQLKEGYTSKFTNSAEVVDNSEYLLTDAASIFEMYVGLSAISMDFLLILIVGFGAYGAAHYFGKKGVNKIEGKKNNDTSGPWIAGVAMGVILFFPNEGGESQDGYEKLNNRYQDFEKFGYYTFADWSEKVTKVAIDIEMGNLILKSGLGTKEQIVSTAAQQAQAEKLQTFYENNFNACRNTIYKSDYLFHNDNKSVFGENDKAIFPSTEHWAYVAYAAKSLADGYYEKGAGGVLQDGAAADGRYPKLAFSSCGKAEYLSTFYEDKKSALDTSFQSLIATQGSNQNTAKMSVLGNIFGFQYQLYKDWGVLSILGLPITKMQAAQINGSGNSSIVEKIMKDGVSIDKTVHSILSSIPYMFVPGAGTVFDLVKNNGMVVGAATGAIAAGSTAPGDGVVHGILSAVGAWYGGLAGGVIGSTDTGAGLIAGLITYKAVKIILTLLPIVGLVTVGLLRFIIIILKVFAFHFLSLFVLPIVFLQRNFEAMGKFTGKILATMLEIPIFALAVWLAITAHSLITTMGNAFRNNILNGMFGADAAQTGDLKLAGFDLGDMFSTMVIYIFDGFFELAITLFAIIIMYKIVISLHNWLFDVVDLTTSTAIDNSIDAMRSESSNWGSKI
ncbi:MAG: hypothetical protein Q8N78_03800, partial [Sulfurimonas sp.]|nr:hypothetical protein [Sulfurimonas sp.]